MRKKRQKYKTSDLQKTKNIIIFLILIMLFGSLVGAIFGYYIQATASKSLDYITNSNFLFPDIEQYNYISLILKNSKYLIVIWFLGFTFLGYIFILLLTFIKGFSFGFTSAIIFKQLYLEGISFALKTYVPTSFIYIPVYIFAAITAINNIKNKDKANKNNIINYCKTLIIIIVFSIIISGLDLLLLKVF